MTKADANPKALVLVVEDEEYDAWAIRNAFANNADVGLEVVEDGEQAMARLRREPPYEQASLPDLVLLDLNLPRKSGHEVLEEIKTDPVLRVIPVTVLTTSDAPEDRLRSYGHHANAYIEKPVTRSTLHSMAKQLSSFWFELASLPPHQAG